MKKVYFLIIVMFITGCSYKSNDVFFTTDSEKWQKIPHENKSIYQYGDGYISIYNIDVSSYLIQKKKSIDYSSMNEGVTDIFITYTDLDVNPTCSKNDFIAIVNDEIYRSKSAVIGNTNAHRSLLSCWYSFDFDVESIDQFTIKFFKLKAPTLILKKVNMIRKHSVPLS